MTRRRRRGTAVHPVRRLALQPRDVELLVWIGRAGVAELPHIANLFWGGTSGSRAAAARRLRVLADHGLLQTSVTALHKPNRVSLLPRGVEFVPLRLAEGVVLRTRVVGTSVSADHLAASAAIWASLAVRLIRPGSPRLRRFMTEAEIRRTVGTVHDGLIPDGIAILETSRGASAAFAIEVDLGSEALPVLNRKLVRYAPFLAEGSPFHGLRLDAVIIYAPGTTRLERIGRLAARSSIGTRVFLQDVAGVGPDNVLEDLMVAPPDQAAPPLVRGVALL